MFSSKLIKAIILVLLTVTYSTTATARYLQSDPIGLQGGINTYTYVKDNPLIYTDPTGLVPNPAEAACVLGPNPVCGVGVAFDLLTYLGSATAVGWAAHKAKEKHDQAKQCSMSEEPRDCDKEWQGARNVCRQLIFEEMEQAAGRKKKRSVTGVTGGFKDIEECARGLVSEECGGNKVKF